MTEKELKKFFNFLKESWAVFGPKTASPEDNKKPIVLVEPLDNFEDLVLDSRLPFFSFKRFFVPEYEALFEYRGAELKSPLQLPPLVKRGEGGFDKTVLFGMNLLDLKSILLYDQVFEKDSYYQARRQNILVIGHSLIPDLPQNIFEETFEEDVLEHLSFDIFLADTNPSTRLAARSGDNDETLPPEPFDKTQGKLKSKAYKVFTGSLAGQKVLNNFGYDKYTHIQFSGPVKEGKLDERMILLKEKLKNRHNQKIWDELGARCIECGKCTIACPTCFCFRIDDQAELGANTGERQRCWDSCFYQEFSEIAGGHKFLSGTAQRIYFWYYHKFARIPDEFDFIGCVGCRRCAAVCPVGIDIEEVLKSIEES